jgi:hypothetical protein
MNAQERLDYLLETVQVRNSTGWTVKKILQQSGLASEVAVMVAGKLESSLGAMASSFVPFTQTTLNALSQESGLSIDDDVSQALIDQLATYSQSLPEELRWDAEFVAIVKALGVNLVPRWTTAGYQTEPTLQQITVEVRKQELEDAWQDRLQAAREALSSWDGTGEEPVL